MSGEDKPNLPPDKKKNPLEGLQGQSWDLWDAPETVTDSELEEVKDNNFSKFYSFSSPLADLLLKHGQLLANTPLPAELSHAGQFPQDSQLNLSICMYCNMAFKTGSNIHNDCLAKAIQNALEAHKRGEQSAPSGNPENEIEINLPGPSRSIFSASNPKLPTIKATTRTFSLTTYTVKKKDDPQGSSPSRIPRLIIQKPVSSFKATVSTSHPKFAKVYATKQNSSSNVTSNKNATNSKDEHDASPKPGTKRPVRALRLYSSSSEDEIASIISPPPIIKETPPPSPRTTTFKPMGKFQVNDRTARKRKSHLDNVEAEQEEETDTEVLHAAKKTKLRLKKRSSTKMGRFSAEEQKEEQIKSSLKTKVLANVFRSAGTYRSHSLSRRNYLEENSYETSQSDSDNQNEGSDSEKSCHASENDDSPPILDDCTQVYLSSSEDNSQSTSPAPDISESLMGKVSSEEEDIIELTTLPKLEEDLDLNDFVDTQLPTLAPQLSLCALPRSTVEELQAKIIKFWPAHKVPKMMMKLITLESSIRLMNKLNFYPRKELLYKWPHSCIFPRPNDLSINFLKLINYIGVYKTKFLKDALVPSKSQPIGASFKGRHNHCLKATQSSELVVAVTNSATKLLKRKNSTEAIATETLQSVTETDVLRLFDIISCSKPIESQNVQSLVVNTLLPGNDNQTSASPARAKTPPPEPTKNIDEKPANPNLSDPFSMDSILECFQEYRSKLQEIPEPVPNPKQEGSTSHADVNAKLPPAANAEPIIPVTSEALPILPSSESNLSTSCVWDWDTSLPEESDEIPLHHLPDWVIPDPPPAQTVQPANTSALQSTLSDYTNWQASEALLDDPASLLDLLTSGPTTTQLQSTSTDWLFPNTVATVQKTSTGPSGIISSEFSVNEVPSFDYSDWMDTPKAPTPKSEAFLSPSTISSNLTASRSGNNVGDWTFQDYNSQASVAYSTVSTSEINTSSTIYTSAQEAYSSAHPELSSILNTPTYSSRPRNAINTISSANSNWGYHPAQAPVPQMAATIKKPVSIKPKPKTQLQMNVDNRAWLQRKTYSTAEATFVPGSLDPPIMSTSQFRSNNSPSWVSNANNRSSEQLYQQQYQHRQQPQLSTQSNSIRGVNQYGWTSTVPVPSRNGSISSSNSMQNTAQPWSQIPNSQNQQVPLARLTNNQTWTNQHQGVYSAGYNPQKQQQYYIKPAQPPIVDLTQEDSPATVQPALPNHSTPQLGTLYPNWNSNYGNNLNSGRQLPPNWIQGHPETNTTANAPPNSYYGAGVMGCNYSNAPREMYTPSPNNYQLGDPTLQQKSPVDQNNLSPISVSGWLELQQRNLAQVCLPNQMGPPGQYLQVRPDYTQAQHQSNYQMMWNTGNPSNLVSHNFPRQQHLNYPAAHPVMRHNFVGQQSNLGRFNNGVQFGHSIPESIPSIPTYTAIPPTPVIATPNQLGNQDEHFYQNTNAPTNLQQCTQENPAPSATAKDTYQCQAMANLPPDQQQPIQNQEFVNETPMFAMLDLSAGLIDYDFDLTNL